MLQLVDVHKSYRLGDRVVPAVRGVSFSIDHPGFYAIMGASGSGKSTLLHLLAGLDRPDHGRISVQGEDIATMPERQLTAFRRTRLGIVFQQFNLVPTLTTEQNVGLPGELDRQPRAWIRKRVATLLDQLGLADRAHHRPDAMSGGEQQRVAIARALLFQPSVLLADEPTGALDSTTSMRMWRLLDDIAARQSMAVVMVTHEAAAASHCKRVFVLGDGLCRGSFDVDERNPARVAARYQQLAG